MTQIRVQHDLTKADKPPARVALPPGTYHAIIIGVTVGLTRQVPSLGKFTVEFRILKDADGGAEHAGRRIYQDYVYEQSQNPEQDAREAFRIRQLLDATQVSYSEVNGGFDFNTDHLQTRPVRVAVSQRPARNPGPDGSIPIYNRVDRVDLAEGLSDAEAI